MNENQLILNKCLDYLLNMSVTSSRTNEYLIVINCTDNNATKLMLERYNIPLSNYYMAGTYQSINIVGSHLYIQCPVPLFITVLAIGSHTNCLLSLLLVTIFSDILKGKKYERKKWL